MGQIGILNVGAGDTKISFDKNNPAERIRSARIVTDMLRRGYALLVEVTDKRVRPAKRGSGNSKRIPANTSSPISIPSKQPRKTLVSETTNQPMNRQQRRHHERQLRKALLLPQKSRVVGNATGREQSALRKQPGSRYLGPQEVDRGIKLLEQFDGMAPLRNGLRRIAGKIEEWAGIPMAMEGCKLVIEPTYGMAASLMAIGREQENAEEIDPTFRVRNTFFSWKYRRNITVWELKGRVYRSIDTDSNPVDLLMDTLNASDAWGIDQERNAIDTLGTLLRHRQFKQYLLTGMFMESSKRSGLHYLFRRLRPTLAISDKRGYLRCIAALCMHPIGYYEGSWAGAMTPTDDVVAHLMLMRGDEHMFWRRSNQHPAWVPQAGLG